MKSLILILALAIAAVPAALAGSKQPQPGTKAYAKQQAKDAKAAKREAIRWERQQARERAYLAQQQWRAEHPAEAAYQDALAAYRNQVLSNSLLNFGMALLTPRPTLTCTSSTFFGTTTTTCR